MTFLNRVVRLGYEKGVMAWGGRRVCRMNVDWTKGWMLKERKWHDAGGQTRRKGKRTQGGTTRARTLGGTERTSAASKIETEGERGSSGVLTVRGKS